jgi:cyclohexa-1,5-dienecarbonyl-CoA hydratase
MRAAPANDSPLKTWLEQEETLLRIRLSVPKANIIDAAMVVELAKVFDQQKQAYAEAAQTKIRAILLDAEGPHFSLEQVLKNIFPEITQLCSKVFTLVTADAECTCADFGRNSRACLGGGLELACAGSQLFASPEAKLGQPEIVLGVIAPAASCLLPLRVGQLMLKICYFPDAVLMLLKQRKWSDSSNCGRSGSQCVENILNST